MMRAWMDEWREGWAEVDDASNPVAELALAFLGMAVGFQPAHPQGE